jgi:hypothetical protein
MLYHQSQKEFSAKEQQSQTRKEAVVEQQKFKPKS